MLFRALDGGSRVGASCYYLETKLRTRTVRLITDCGIRFGENRQSIAPDDVHYLDRVHINIILITHAHVDHSGALALLARLHPEAKIVMTEATAEMTEVMLLDSLHIAERHGVQPVFTLEDKVALMRPGRITCLAQGHWYVPFPDEPEFKILAHPAGHIRGAVSFIIVTPSGTIMFSGDVSRHDTPTVLGAKLPPVKIDALVTEMTYGNIGLPPYEHEIKRLVKRVLEKALFKKLLIILTNQLRFKRVGEIRRKSFFYQL